MHQNLTAIYSESDVAKRVLRYMSLPVGLVDAFTDLVVGQVAVLLGVLALLSGSVCGASDGVGIGVHLFGI